MATKRSPRRQLIGVVHLSPLPGSPRFGARDARAPAAFEDLVARAVGDARALVAGGVDALIVENFGDTPFHKDTVPSETVAAMALCLDAIRRAVKERIPLGVNVLRNDARAALGLCAATGARFLRVNVHVGAAVTDQGLVEGRAAETLRERARLCPGTEIWADVHVKHATPLGRESLVEAAHDTLERGLADALIVSGRATGLPPDPADVARLRASLPRARIYLGSGVSAENARELLASADGAIVGTALKRDGRVEQPVELQRVKRMRALFDRAGAAP